MDSTNQPFSNYSIFSDASFDPKSRIGVAGYLILSHGPGLENFDVHENDLLIKTKVVEKTNNTRMEWEAALWALETIEKQHFSTLNFPGDLKLTLFTDCKAIVEILERRQRLESQNFTSRKGTKNLNNSDLYKRFFILYDRLKPTISWVKGHFSKRDRNREQSFFYCVDSAVRNELRSLLAIT